MIELLAVITVICLIGLISLPAVSNMTKQMDEKEYQRYLNDIYLATETYMGIHKYEYEDFTTAGQSITISVSELIGEELIKVDMKNPQTGQPISSTDTVTVTIQSDLTYEYEYISS